MNVGPTPGALRIEVDRRESRLDLNEVDRIMYDVRDAVATRLPQVANVDPRNAQIVLEPTIFYVRGSNFGDTWAGGATTPLGNNAYRIRVLFFYINSQRRVMDWREFLIHEAINFYVMSVGRPDLAA